LQKKIQEVQGHVALKQKRRKNEGRRTQESRIPSGLQTFRP